MQKADISCGKLLHEQRSDVISVFCTASLINPDQTTELFDRMFQLEGYLPLNTQKMRNSNINFIETLALPDP